MRTRTMVAAVALGVAVAPVAVGVAVVPAGAAAAAPSVAAAAPYCGITWGSNLEQVPEYSTGVITNLRSGRHDCWDRLVIDLGPGTPAGYHVGYTPVVTQDGSGDPVPLAGGAFLQVNVLAPGHDQDYDPTYDPADPAHAVNVAGYSTFRQVAWAGTFEAVSTIGLGVRARLPFRAFTLTGPGGTTRLVIDVAHRW